MVRMATDKHWLADNFAKQNQAQCVKYLRDWLLTTADWHEVYELLESFPRWAQYSDRAPWIARVTTLLQHEFSPYRFAANRLVPITSPEELAVVSQAVVQPGKYALASEHMSKALGKFNARPQPDYENAAKEAASAVESALFAANGKRTSMGDAIRTFASQFSVHRALMESASNLFGYASDRDGVRHGKQGTGKNLDFDETKLVIVSASAWVNFIATTAP
jgi:hypothetical protein